MEDNTKVAYSKNHVVWAFFVGLVVGLGAYYVWDTRISAFDRSGKDEAYDETLGGDIVAITESKNSVSVDDQLAGFVVHVDKATLAEAGWVVIQEDVEGTPLYLLGASRRDAGTYENVDVDLLRNTEEGSTYYAVIYSDDGDKQFDNKKDMPVTTSDGNPVMTAFEIVRR